MLPAFYRVTRNPSSDLAAYRLDQNLLSSCWCSGVISLNVHQTSRQSSFRVITSCVAYDLCVVLWVLGGFGFVFFTLHAEKLEVVVD